MHQFVLKKSNYKYVFVQNGCCYHGRQTELSPVEPSTPESEGECKVGETEGEAEYVEDQSLQLKVSHDEEYCGFVSIIGDNS